MKKFWTLWCKKEGMTLLSLFQPLLNSIFAVGECIHKAAYFIYELKLGKPHVIQIYNGKLCINDRSPRKTELHRCAGICQSSNPIYED